MILRALVLVQKARGISPGQRFRIEQWEPYLRSEHGIELEYVVFESPRLTRVLYSSGHTAEKAMLLLKDALRRRSAVAAAKKHDVVVIFREAALIGPPLYEWLIARTGVPIVYDFDDAIWTAPHRTMLSANDTFRVLKFARKTSTICKLAGVVTVGNAYLARWASRYNGRVHVVPTSIELGAYSVQPRLPADQPFTVVWSGTFSTLEHLAALRVPLERLGRSRTVRLNVICDRAPPYSMANVDVRFIPWKADDEARAIGTGHVGIMPLPDDEFARGKCGCKILQYMAAGRTAVASPVGVNVDIIRHGENGFLASTHDGWTSILEQLATSESMRDRVAAAGRSTVEMAFSSRRSAALFAGAIKAAHASAGGTRRSPTTPKSGGAE